MATHYRDTSRLRRVIRYFLRRLTEPSTYAGLAAIGTLLGVRELQQISTSEIVAGLSALAAIFLREADDR